MSSFKVLKWIIVSSAPDTKISRNCLLLSNRKPETVGGDERLAGLELLPGWCLHLRVSGGAGRGRGTCQNYWGHVTQLGNILGTNPDQFYLNTIRRVDQDYCIVMVITRKTLSGKKKKLMDFSIYFFKQMIWI